MLNCQLCNYYSAEKGHVCKCELTGFVFHKKVEDYEMDNHPCYEYDVKAQNSPIKMKEIKLNKNLRIA